MEIVGAIFLIAINVAIIWGFARYFKKLELQCAERKGHAIGMHIAEAIKSALNDADK